MAYDLQLRFTGDNLMHEFVRTWEGVMETAPPVILGHPGLQEECERVIGQMEGSIVSSS